MPPTTTAFQVHTGGHQKAIQMDRLYTNTNTTITTTTNNNNKKIIIIISID